MSEKKKYRVKVSKNGPYIVTGGLPLLKQIIEINDNNESIGWTEGQKYPDGEQYALCRCGHSKNHPYCDGTHAKIKFEGKETASRDSYFERARKIEGPELILCDVQDLCAYARFCDVDDRVWKLVGESDDPEKNKLCISEAINCPSGRLVIIDKRMGKKIEPKFVPSIGLIEDTAEKTSGPIWVKGAIQIESADGYEYEIREKQTLCRCGQSENKPFCNGAHSSCKFSDKN
jgi:CDGSH-type Zn-finger protein